MKTPALARALAGQNGMSVLELVVATTVAIVFAFAGWSFQRRQAEELAAQSASLEATERIRGAVDFMVREIRRAGYDPRLSAFTVAGAKGISQARSDLLLFQLDKNENGSVETTATDPNAESILYSYDSTNHEIVRTVNGVAQTLVENVPSGGFVLEYFDAAGSSLAMTGTPPELDSSKRDRVAYMRMRLRVESSGTSLAETLKLTSRVTVRQRVLDRL